jgi:hypothetical protein
MRKCQFGRLGDKDDCANKRQHAADEIFFHDKQEVIVYQRHFK